MRAVAVRDVFCVHRTACGDAVALQGATLTVARGEIVCVLGPSGAGKTTLLRVVAGLQNPSAGEVSVLGEDIGRAPERSRARLRHACLGFLSQRSAATLPPDLTIGAAIMLPLALRGATAQQQTRRRDELLEALELSDLAAALPCELAGGERQQAALGAALAHRPQLLLADEPTAELDADAAARVRDLIAALVRAEQGTAIVVTHDPAMAEIADRTLRIRDGRIVEEDDALLVGGGGWVRLGAELLAESGIGDRVRVERTADGLLVRRDGSATREPSAGEEAPAAPIAPAWDATSVEVRGLTRGHGRNIVFDGFSHAFAPGVLTAVVGRSGAGKTTLLTLLAGLDVPDAGELVIDGVAVQNDTAEQRAARRRRSVGFLPQDPAPVGFLSAEENVALALRVRGLAPPEAGRRAREVLVRLGLGGRAGQRVSRLSTGEAQRVALARALACARGLAIVDEPTSRLDERAAEDVAGLLANVAEREGQTIICASHDERLIARAHAVLDLSRPGPAPAR